MPTCVELAHTTYPSQYNGHSIKPRKGETVKVAFNVKSASRTAIICRLENGQRVHDKLIDARIELTGDGIRHVEYVSKPIAEGGNHQLVFYLGLTEGDVWIDDVTLSYSM